MKSVEFIWLNEESIISLLNRDRSAVTNGKLSYPLLVFINNQHPRYSKLILWTTDKQEQEEKEEENR